MTGFLIEHKLLPKSPVGIFMKMTNNIDNKESALRIHDWRLAVRDILGPGIRAVVWVQGCSLHCDGCIAPETWSKESGSLVDPHVLAETILKNETIEGITVSGGEPTEQPYAVAELLACMKLAGKNTWVYSGHTLDELVAKNDPDLDRMLAFTDVLVDGRFDKMSAGIYTYRGSENQRILHLQDLGQMDDSDVKEQSRLEITLDKDGQMVVVGVPPPEFLNKLKDALSRRGVQVDYKSGG